MPSLLVVVVIVVVACGFVIQVSRGVRWHRQLVAITVISAWRAVHAVKRPNTHTDTATHTHTHTLPHTHPHTAGEAFNPFMQAKLLFFPGFIIAFQRRMLLSVSRCTCVCGSVRVRVRLWL